MYKKNIKKLFSLMNYGTMEYKNNYYKLITINYYYKIIKLYIFLFFNFKKFIIIFI